MRVGGYPPRGVAEFTGLHKAAQATVFGKACRAYCDASSRDDRRANTSLRRLAQQSPTARGLEEERSPGHGTKQYVIAGDGRCIDLVHEAHLASPLQPCEPSPWPAAGAGTGSKRVTDQFQKVDTVPVPMEQDISKSAEREAQAKKEDEEHDRNVSLANAYWQEKA